MAFNYRGGHASHDQPMVEINTTPLVDVMLVLLVIFIITAPLINQNPAVSIDLPQAAAAPLDKTLHTVQVSLNEKNVIFVNGVRTEKSALREKLRGLMAQDRPVAEMQLRADRRTHYEQIAEIMAIAQDAGIAKIAFVTEIPG